MLKFYNDLPIESVSQAKKEAKDASLLVLAELAKRDETAEARQEREVASTPFWPLRANVCMLQKTHFVKTHNLLWASVAFSDLDDDGRLERSKSVWRQEQSRQRKKKNFEKQPLPCRRIWRALFWSTPGSITIITPLAPTQIVMDPYNLKSWRLSTRRVWCT